MTNEEKKLQEKAHSEAVQMLIDRKNGKSNERSTIHKNEPKESHISSQDVAEYINQKLKK